MSRAAFLIHQSTDLTKNRHREHREHRELGWQPSRWQFLIWLALSTVVVAPPVRAAERIEFSYNLLGLYLPVESLETFAQTGTVDSELRFYLQFVDSTVEADLRNALQISHQISPWELSQMLYSPIGEEVLQNIGALIQTESRQNGFYALRAALVESAADPGGLSVIGLLRHFPTSTVHVDATRLLQLAEQLAQFTELTDQAIAEIHTRSQTAAKTDAIHQAALQENGPFQLTQQTLVLRDETRRREIPTDLYIPSFGATLPRSIPVVVYSHGYGETRSTAAPFLKLLASYGFVVAAPEHIGSDYQFQQDLLTGIHNESFAASEFVDRPLDVSYVLDMLQQQNASEFGNRLNLQQVGAVGHSFGGYTVLTLAGATVDFEQLQHHCQQDFLWQSFDSALLLECRALELSSRPQLVEQLTSGKLRDPRIQSIAAITPVAGPIFEQQSLSQIDIPVMLFSGSKDPVTPVVPEQLRAFSLMTTPDRYLVLVDNAAHDAQITALVDQFLLPAQPDVAAGGELNTFLSHLRNVGLAFMQVYTAGQLDYQPYLASAYVESLDVEPFDFSLIRSFPPEDFEQLTRKTNF
jgi:predicted dienelactone hydrolase